MPSISSDARFLGVDLRALWQEIRQPWRRLHESKALSWLTPDVPVLLLQADDLRRDPGGTLDAVGGFLGAPPRGAVEHRDVHVGQDVGAKLPDADVAYLREIYADDMARLAQLTGVSFW